MNVSWLGKEWGKSDGGNHIFRSKSLCSVQRIERGLYQAGEADRACLKATVSQAQVAGFHPWGN